MSYVRQLWGGRAKLEICRIVLRSCVTASARFEELLPKGTSTELTLVYLAEIDRARSAACCYGTSRRQGSGRE